MFGGGFQKLVALGQYIVEMFDQLDEKSRKRLVVYCCKGRRCHGDDPASKVFYQFIPGEPEDDKVVIWLKMGRNEAYVMDPEPPSNEKAHWKLVDKLRD
jgi:hypothetical protein